MTVTKRENSALWAPERWRITLGLVLVITLAAFESIGLATALPTMMRELDGRDLYAWPVMIFLAASAMGTALGGSIADRRGPTWPLLSGLALFALGLLVAGCASTVESLLVGRALQGVGSGAEVVAVYVVIARAYASEHRPAAMGAISASWVLPGMVGPAVAGVLTEQLSWRWVFLGLAPFVVVSVVLLAPLLRSLPETPTPDGNDRRGVVLPALAAGAGVVLVNWGVQGRTSWAWLVGAVGLAVLLWGARALLPPGTVTGRPGIPVMVLARGLLMSVFAAAGTFVPLTLTAVHHYSPAGAGFPLTLAALGWAAGSAYQGRRASQQAAESSPDADGVRRERFVAWGFGLLAVAVGGFAMIAPVWGPHWLVFLLWPIGGAGMGIAVSAASVRVLDLSPSEQQGFHSSALQLSSTLWQSLGVGLAGALVISVAGAALPTAGVVVLDLGLAAVSVLGALLVVRSMRWTRTG